jgi:hypothetical protein
MKLLQGVRWRPCFRGVLGRKIAFVDAKPESIHEDMTKMGLPEFVVVTVLRFYETVREGRWHISSAVRDLLGRPATSYESWLSTNADFAKGPAVARFMNK